LYREVAPVEPGNSERATGRIVISSEARHSAEKKYSPRDVVVTASWRRLSAGPSREICGKYVSALPNNNTDFSARSLWSLGRNDKEEE
jgi:hypothetical protein